MSRINPVEVSEVGGKVQALLDPVGKALGFVPNLMRTLAHSPAALEGYLSFSRILGGGKLGAQLREQIGLAMAGLNECEYCAAAHGAMGRHAGLDEAELRANVRGESGDARAGAALRFARAVVEERGFVSDEELASVRGAGFGDDEIAEIVAAVALNAFSNYFNHVAQTEVDFPRIGDPVAQTG